MSWYHIFSCCQRPVSSVSMLSSVSVSVTLNAEESSTRIPADSSSTFSEPSSATIPPQIPPARPPSPLTPPPSPASTLSSGDACECSVCEAQHTVNQAQSEPPGLLDGMLWQNIHPQDVKDEDGNQTTSADGGHSVKDDECVPDNMSNGRLSSTNESEDTMPNVLEPQVQIIPQFSPMPPPHKPLTRTPIPPIPPLPILTNSLQAIEQARIQQNFLQKLNELSNTLLNLNSLDEIKRKNGHKRSQEKIEEQIKHDCGTATEEERLYFTAKRQHAIWEHEAKMKILNMELRQKEEIFAHQKQLFLIELSLKMDFLKKASAK